MANRYIIIFVAALSVCVAIASKTMAAEPAITTYGERNAQAPAQLSLFSFLVGKWKGVGKSHLEDGKVAESELTWIGRYILDGTAIADEIHGDFNGRPYLGITLRRFDTARDSWVIEFLNVSNSFLRKQVNPRMGSVTQNARTVVMISEDGLKRIRESYRVDDQNHFTYSMDTSNDEGRSWGPVTFEMSMTRVE